MTNIRVTEKLTGSSSLGKALSSFLAMFLEMTLAPDSTGGEGAVPMCSLSSSWPASSSSGASEREEWEEVRPWYITRFSSHGLPERGRRLILVTSKVSFEPYYTYSFDQNGKFDSDGKFVSEIKTAIQIDKIIIMSHSQFHFSPHYAFFPSSIYKLY